MLSETLCRLTYSAFCTLILPFVLLRLVWKARRDADYGVRIGERLGFYTVDPRCDSIWIHAVSVGELLAAAPLVATLARDYPQFPILLTTTTPAASRLVRERFGDQVEHVYAAWDLGWIARRFVRQFRPRIAIFMETELWPNLIHVCAAMHVPVIVANARLSARSATAYGRVLRPLSRAMMRQLHAVAAQSEADATRFKTLGVPAQRVHVTGSVKFDIVIDAAQRALAAEFRTLIDPGSEISMWIAASTHEGEEEIVLQALKRLQGRHPEMLLLLAPRHAERTAAVMQLVRRHGFVAALRSQHHDPQPGLQVLIVDTLGELPWLYGAADIAFVGGSLVAAGGHNLVEPAAWSLPLLSGGQLYNVEVISNALRACGALLVVQDSQTMAAALAELFGDAARRNRMGAAAASLVATGAGATQRILALVRASLV